MKLLEKLHSKFGDFWWWSLCLFLALRAGDVINAIVGLWLVPKYVGQEQLGAVLPLTQVASVFGLPISILVVTFTKFLNQYHTKGEAGKVKALIRSFWGLSLVAITLGTGAAILLLPHFFERIRVVSGSLGVLIIASAILGTTAPVFTNGLQALKKFKAITIMNLCCAPIRLLVMLVAMPFRALSGYMLGQSAPSAFQIAWSFFSLRKELRKSIKAVDFWHEDKSKILKYSFSVALWLGMTVLLGTLQSMLVRQRLPELESAAYYIISRFAELSAYVGNTVIFMIFPFAAEQHVRGKDATVLLMKSGACVLLFGLALACVLALLGSPILRILPCWAEYAGFHVDMALLAVSNTLSAEVSLFVNYETASSRFGFSWYVLPLWVFNVGTFACFTGYGFFDGILPSALVQWMAACHLGTLRNFILLNIFCNCVTVLACVLHLFLRRKSERGERVLV